MLQRNQAKAQARRLPQETARWGCRGAERAPRRGGMSPLRGHAEEDHRLVVAAGALEGDRPAARREADVAARLRGNVEIEPAVPRYAERRPRSAHGAAVRRGE